MASDNPLLAYELRPSTEIYVESRDRWYRTNAAGWRDDDEFVVPKPEGTFRVLVVGDSVTFGWRQTASATYPKVLERLCREDGRNVEVFDLGIGGYNTLQEVEVVATRGLALDPDLVIVGYVARRSVNRSGARHRARERPGRVMREGGQAREAPEYAPRRPEATILYRVVQHQLETWLGNARIHERTVPRFVERELRASLDWGIFANAFFDSIAMRAAWSAWSRFPAKDEDSVHPAADVTWPTRQPISWIAYCRGCPCANVHFHTLILDGTHRSADNDPTLRFHSAPPPESEELERVHAPITPRARSSAGYSI